MEGVVLKNRRFECVVGTDLDFTITDFVRTEGALNQAKLVAGLIGGDPHTIQKELEEISLAIIDKDLKQIANIKRVFDEHIHCVDDPLEECLWSTAARFLFFMEVRGIDPKTLYAHANRAEHLFWKGVGDHSALYEDARHFREVLHELRLPVFALTSSDARTRFRSSVGPHGRLEYDVDHSIEMKYLRLQPSRVFDLIPRKDIIVSDPWHKHDIRLWNERVFPRYLDRPDREQWVFLGDTIFDMLAAQVAGVGTRIFLRRHKHTTVPSEATHVADSLTEAATIIRGLI